jgi:hypothetical protein
MLSDMEIPVTRLELFVPEEFNCSCNEELILKCGVSPNHSGLEVKSPSVKLSFNWAFIITGNRMRIMNTENLLI